MTFEIAIATPPLVRDARGNPTIPQRAKASLLQGPTTPSYFEHILGLLLLCIARSKWPDSTRTEDPADLLGGCAVSVSCFAIKTKANDVMPPPTGRDQNPAFGACLGSLDTQSSAPMAASIFWDCFATPILSDSKCHILSAYSIFITRLSVFRGLLFGHSLSVSCFSS